MTELPTAEERHEVVCPHCHKEFEAELIDGAAERYRGFKCPHCKLFVPLERAADPEAPDPIVERGHHPFKG